MLTATPRGRILFGIGKQSEQKELYHEGFYLAIVFAHESFNDFISPIVLLYTINHYFIS